MKIEFLAGTFADILERGLSRVIKFLIKADEINYYEEGLDIHADSKRAWKVVKEVLNVEDNTVANLTGDPITQKIILYGQDPEKQSRFFG